MACGRLITAVAKELIIRSILLYLTRDTCRAVVCRAGARLRRLPGGAGALPRQPAVVSAVLSDALQCRHRQSGNATIVLPNVRTYVRTPSVRNSGGL